MPKRKKRVTKQLESLKRVLDEHIEKFEQDVEQDRFSAAHHKQEIEALKREIAAKRVLLQKGKRRKGRKEVS